MLMIIFQVTRLREYQGVDQDFDEIARRYHDLVTVSSQILLKLLILVLHYCYVIL